MQIIILTLAQILPRLYRDIQSDSLHLHLLDDKDKGFVPVGIQVAALDAGLLLLSNPLLLLVKQLELDIRVGGASDVHLLQFPSLQNSNCEKKACYNFQTESGIQKHNYYLSVFLTRERI